MGSIKEKAQNILNEKNLKIVPENIKSGVTIFDVSGNYNGVVINNQDKVIAPSTSIQNIIADQGYTGLNQVTVNAVTSNIDSNIQPNYIANGINILGVTGTFEGSGGGGSGDVKLFNTINEMQNSSGNQDGDLAVVYKSEENNITENTEFQIGIFPETVVLPSAVTSSSSLSFYSLDSTKYFDCYGSLSSSSFYINGYSNSSYIDIRYTSSDGITYTRTTFQKNDETIIGNKMDFDVIIKFGSSWGGGYTWNDAFGYFIKSRLTIFNGLFQYQVNSYNIAETQLDTINSYVYTGKTFYSNEGIGIGTLSSNPSNQFTDIDATIYFDIQSKYDNMTPLIMYDNVPYDKNCLFIPTKSNGQSLLDTSNVNNMSYSFNNYKKLTFIPNLDTTNATEMSYMFNGCSNLKSIPNFDTSNVTTMSGMFCGCENLAYISNLNTSKVNFMYNMFSYCKALETIPNFDTSNVTAMDNMFFACNRLVYLPNLNTSKVTTFSSMFEYCNNLVTLPEFNSVNVTSFAHMCAYCNNLSNESIQNIINMCLNSNVNSYAKTLKNDRYSGASPFYCTNITNDRYQNRWAELDAAGWTY